MSGPADPMERHAALWQAPAVPPRWVIWHAGEGDVVVFDRKFNIPVDVADADLAEVVRRMRAAGAPEGEDYPGRPC